MSEAALPAETKAPPAPKGRSLWDDARRRLIRNPAALASLCVVTLLVVLAAVGPQFWLRISGADAGTIFRAEIAIPPTSAHMHWLGTDTEGRDMVARALLGLRISLLVGIAATLVALTIGVAWGAIAGLIGGAVDEVMMRLVDVLYTIPFIFFVIVLVTMIDPPDPVIKLRENPVGIQNIKLGRNRHRARADEADISEAREVLALDDLLSKVEPDLFRVGFAEHGREKVQAGIESEASPPRTSPFRSGQ